jgi:hypothetical protein
MAAFLDVLERLETEAPAGKAQWLLDKLGVLARTCRSEPGLHLHFIPDGPGGSSSAQR